MVATTTVTNVAKGAAPVSIGGAIGGAALPAILKAPGGGFPGCCYGGAAFGATHMAYILAVNQWPQLGGASGPMTAIPRFGTDITLGGFGVSAHGGLKLTTDVMVGLLGQTAWLLAFPHTRNLKVVLSGAGGSVIGAQVAHQLVSK